MELTNFDKFKVVEKKGFILNGEEYLIKYDTSVETMLSLLDLLPKVEGDPSAMRKAIDVIWRELLISNENKDEKKFKDSLTISMLDPLFDMMLNNAKKKEEINSPKKDKGEPLAQQS